MRFTHHEGLYFERFGHLQPGDTVQVDEEWVAILATTKMFTLEAEGDEAEAKEEDS